jgi:hypothetical protein
MKRLLKSRGTFSTPQLTIFIIAFSLIGYLIFRSFALNPNLPGDLNNDNTVNITDMSILLSNYGTSNSTADINSDGTVNVLDMSILLSNYGKSATISKPSIPTGLTATAGDGKVTLNWSANPSTDQVDVYQVYVNGANTNLSVTGTSYTVTGLANGTTYQFRVSAHNSSGYGDWTAAVTATPQGTTGGGTIGTPVWNGDFETGNLSQWGGWEYGGTFDGTPALNQRSSVGTNIDGFSPLQGSYFNKVSVAPGDAYGSATGWRTLARQYEPIKPINAGYDSWYTWGMLLPNGYPGDAKMWQTGPEMHQSKAPYVSVTGVAPFHFIAYGTYMHIDVAGGRDGARTVYVDQAFLNNYAHNTWYIFAMHYKHGLTPNGAFEFYYGKKGDTSMTKLVSLSGIGTMYEQTYNYLLFGIYRDQTGTSTTTAYFDALKEFSSGTDALNYANSLL